MIAAIVPVYNRELYIGAYLEQLIKHNVEPYVVFSDMPWASGGNQEVLEHDKTEKVLSLFKDINVIRGTFNSHKDSFAAAFSYIDKYSSVIINDCDQFFTDEDFEKMLQFIQGEHNIYRIDFESMMIEYYWDYNYGLPAIPGGHPPMIAFQPYKGVRPLNMTDYSGFGFETTWRDPIVKCHHFRWAKPKASGSHKCQIPSNPHAYTKAPQEIVRLLKKWEKKLEKL